MKRTPITLAALGMRFYTGTQFPEEYRGGIFIAEHGSWNRSRKIGCHASLVRLEVDRTAPCAPPTTKPGRCTAYATADNPR